MDKKQTSRDAALDAVFGKNQREENSGLYEFNFEDINVEDVEVQSHESVRMTPSIEEDAEPTPEERVKEEKRKDKVGRVRAFRKGWNTSVGFFTWVKDLVIVGLVIAVILMVAGFETVTDASNEPTMQAGEHILVFKLAYKYSTPARGEMVAISMSASDDADPNDTGVFFARVVGLPGDTVMINANGQIFINDTLLETSYCNGMTGYVYGGLSYPYVVPEDSYFVLSDNPASTIDSRYGDVRAVSLDEIEGKVICCFWPKVSWRPIH